MKVIDYIENSKETIFSFEIIPPLKGKGIEDICEGIDPLMDFNPPFINVTYHREEYEYKKMGNGLLKKVSVKKRPGTVGICAALMNRYKVDAIPHIICGGFTKEETESALIDLKFLGVDNILALRGDPMKNEAAFVPTKGGSQYAVDLIDQIKDMNNGQYLYEETKNSPSNFCIGAAGYPEKHFEAMNLNSDMKNLKKKVDAGAEFIVTQLFYDNKKYFDFVKKCREIGINVPIIPGLKPLTTLRHLSFIPKFFHVNFPEELSNELEKCKTNEEVQKVGVEWSIKQARELIKKEAPVLHFYTMGKGEAVRKIAAQVF
ncbi:MAG: methylenetetrahydrofolate reductase [NAD(P)H] [Crocinitomicaceae bacterium]|nr:methylenetetrahydrofolate reductase [NAD(P)H] [Crocinitomicaceae bacterium]|tara:strand:- start:6099 stop:7049 length:951 start_codon:yes stop_codon:yes gene_type:complete